jgi:hypothetical protein
VRLSVMLSVLRFVPEAVAPLATGVDFVELMG